MAHASVVYVSASTNRYSQAADVSPSSHVIAYASSKLIAFWDVGERELGIFQTVPGHEGLVTCILFVRDDLLVSADDKGVLCCWRRIGSQWMSTVKVNAHNSAISSLCVHDHCLATGSSDATVKIWKLDIGNSLDELTQVQVLPLQGKYPLSLALTSLPQSKAIILACGGTDRNIQIWTRSDDFFVSSVVLSGHEDWVKSLAFRVPIVQDNLLTLASGSQDTTIRLWNIEPFQREKRDVSTMQEVPSDDLLDEFEASLGDIVNADEGGRQISLKRHILTVKVQERSQQFSVTFDALLVGHEAGVTALRWRPASSPNLTPTLLSTSTDSSLILWSPSAAIQSRDQSSCIWINYQRFGDIGGQRLGGFIGGLWANAGKEALAWGWGGGWRRWRCRARVNSSDDEDWTEVGAVGGHCGPIKGIDWSPNGEYLISVGLDQTTRIHGAISVVGSSTPTWHELGRPQVHGYNLLDVVFLEALKFVSIADEKVARVFVAPRGFVQVVEGLGVAEFSAKEHERPIAASVPPLGLSNKAITEVSSQPLDTHASSKHTIRCPFEGELSAGTLWPEVEKVFGHGYELASLAVSNSRRLIATACKATTAEHAVIRVYETGKWHLLGKPLEGHSLTVTRITFSPDDLFILSVSRDRSWRLFQAQGDGKGYLPVAADKSHSRIIWDCAWAHEGDVFATASRDKTVKIWQTKLTAGTRNWVAVATIKTKEAATALSFSAADKDERRWLAVGLETGDILIYSNAQNNLPHWPLDLTICSRIAHVDHIHQLAWRPTDSDSRQLASCSDDGTVRLLSIK